MARSKAFSSKLVLIEVLSLHVALVVEHLRLGALAPVAVAAIGGDRHEGAVVDRDRRDGDRGIPQRRLRKACRVLTP